MKTAGFDLGIAMASAYDDDGFIGIQHDAFGEDQSGTPDHEMHSPYGLLSLPLDPDLDANGQPTSGHCSVMYMWEGSRAHIIPVQDTRVTPKLPRMTAKGSAMFYAATGAYHLIDGGTGSQTLSSGPLTMSLGVDSPGSEMWSAQHSNGQGFFLDAETRDAYIHSIGGEYFISANDEGVTMGITALATDVTGVATYTTMTPLLTALETLVIGINALAVAVNNIVGSPNVGALASPAAIDPSPSPLSTAVTTAFGVVQTACAELEALVLLPSNFSTSVKASE